MPGIGGFILHSRGDYQNALSHLQSSMLWGANYRQADFGFPDQNTALFGCSSPSLHVSRTQLGQRYHSIFIGELYPVERFASARQVEAAHRNFLKEFIGNPQEVLLSTDGAFLIVCWDSVERRLYIANDAFGLLPLNYFLGPEGFFFSSGLAFFRQQLPHLQKDEIALAEKIALGFPLNGKTWIKGVRRLHPGSLLVLSQQKIEVTPYFQPNYDTAPSAPLKVRLEQINNAFRSGVSMRLRSGQRTAISLSGGFDTRLIWSLALAGKHRAVAITHGHSHSADMLIAGKISQKLHIPHQVFDLDRVAADDFLDWAGQLTEKSDGFMNSAAAFLVPYYEWLGRNFDVQIDGAGGAMYRRQHASTWEWRIPGKRTPDRFMYRLFEKTPFRNGIFGAEYRRSVRTEVISGLQAFFDEHAHLGRTADLIDLFYLRQIVGLIYSSDFLFQTHYINCREPFYDMSTYQLAREFTPAERKALHIHRHVLHANQPDLEQFPLEFADMQVPYRGFRYSRLVRAATHRLSAGISRGRINWPQQHSDLFPVNRQLYGSLRTYLLDSRSDNILFEEKVDQSALERELDTGMDSQSLFHLVSLVLLGRWLKQR